VLSALIGLALITLTLLPLALTRGLILSAALRRIGLLRFFSRLDRLVPITALVLALWLISMSSEEIRQVQIILKQKGYAVDVDGMFGPRTRQAVISFQRQQGFQATGEIDLRTSVALGIGNRNESAGDRGGSDQQPTANQQDNQPTSTGQSDGEASRQSPAAQPSQNPARGNSPAAQEGVSPNQPSAGSDNRPSDGSRNQPAPK
jgi:peptidoglycan hydrolase-like protein with peptidoglycan-binding domain